MKETFVKNGTNAMTREQALAEYVDITLYMLAAPVEARYGIDPAVSAAYNAYIDLGGTPADALAALREARQ
jgi:hypothetical protein